MYSDETEGGDYRKCGPENSECGEVGGTATWVPTALYMNTTATWGLTRQGEVVLWRFLDDW